MNLIRFIHSNANLQNVSKSALAVLRKKTGYTFANCRKALELHENDPAKAEKWLREQAKAMGWDKMAKVEGRATNQGLIGVTSSKNKAAMVEVNCETDFVARNNQFRSLVELVASACLKYPVEQTAEISQVSLNSQQLNELKADNGETLANQIALLVGSVGENVALRRAICYSLSSKDTKVAAEVYPPTNSSKGILLGKYGALVVYNTNLEAAVQKDISPQKIGIQLCKHIIGMNPVKIGVWNEDELLENPEDETIMVNQEFLLDPSMTVGQFLEDCGTTVLDYKRFECGQPDKQPETVNDSEVKDNPSEKIEVAQQ